MLRLRVNRYRKWLSFITLLVVTFGFAWFLRLQLVTKFERKLTVHNTHEMVNQYPKKPTIKRKVKRNKDRKTILVWNTFEGNLPEFEKVNNFHMGWDCGGCHVTTDRSKLKSSNAIVYFNNRVTLDHKDWPDQRTRTANQFYIFNSRETPSKTFRFRNSLADIDGMFNLTWYFRKDSDIVSEFGSKEKAIAISHKSEKLNNLKKLMQAKTHLAVWGVSNCYRTYGAAKRMEYAKIMIKAGLNLTTFGICFDNYNKRAEGMDITKHKFYLAFENSLECPDYITEKFWHNSLHQGAVPIVFGPTKNDVLKIAPRKSFIHVDDFSSPTELVDYMNYLDKNDEVYLEYHQWRKNDVTIDHWRNVRMTGLCDICKRVNEDPLRRKIIPSIIDWMYGAQHYASGECLKFDSRGEVYERYKPSK